MIHHAFKPAVALAVVLGLSGCNTTQVGNALGEAGSAIAGGFDTLTSGAFFSDGYLNDRSDACFAQRQSLAENGSFFDKELVTAAVGGAVAGGLIAAVRGDEVWKGALIGGAVGLAGGYLLKMQEEGRSPDSIIGQAFGDVEAENRKIDELLVSFRSLKSCRQDQARGIQSAYNAKSIDKTTAEGQMANVRTLFNQDIAKFRELSVQISENTDSYASIYNEIAADNRSGTLEVKEYKKGRRSARVRKKTPKKAAGTPQGSLKATNRRKVSQLQGEVLTNVRKRDEVIQEVQQAEAGSEDVGLDLATQPNGKGIWIRT